MTPPPEDTEVAVLQATLAGEHAALYAYGVLGGRISRTESPTAAALLDAAYEAHRARRSELRGLLTARDVEPEGARAAYRVDARTRVTGALLAVARGVEDRCAAQYVALAAAGVGEVRLWAIDALTDAAVRRLALGGDPQELPGLGT